MKKIVRFTILAVLMAVAGGAGAKQTVMTFDDMPTCNPWMTPNCLPPQ